MSDSFSDREGRTERFADADPDRLDQIDQLCDRFESECLRGAKPRIEDFIALAADVLRGDLLCELVAVESEHRRKAGESPSFDEYAERFPKFAGILDELFPAEDTLHEQPKSENAKETPAGNPNPSEELTAPAAKRQISSLPPKTRIGNYELIEEIGRGGMGVVYKAQQTRPERIVALKMILSGEFAGEQEIRRFEIEVQAAASLQHPNIVPIYEVGEAGHRRFFSMAYIEGKSLEEVLAAGPLSLRDAASAVKTISDAVHFAHAHGIIHRDLKPANVIVDLQGVPHVTDFGLAKQFDAENQLTATAQLLGTPGFIPPEQIANNPDEVGPRSDVYSLGAILFTTLSGRPPFHSSSPIETLRQVVHDEPISPRLLNRSVPRDLETICLKCLEKKPADRFATAQELSEELRRFLNGEQIRSRPLGRLHRIARWCRRKPAIASLAALLLVSTVVGVTLTAHFALDASHRADQAEKAVLQAAIENARGAIPGLVYAFHWKYFETQEFGKRIDEMTAEVHSYFPQPEHAELISPFQKDSPVRQGGVRSIQTLKGSESIRAEQALVAFREGKASEIVDIDRASSVTQKLEYYAPIRATQSCVQCHEHKKRKVGDVIGIVRIVTPIAGRSLPDPKMSR